MLGLPRFLDNQLTDGGETVSLKVPIHVRVRLGSGPNEPNSSVCGAP
jgi:hypothetical protein